MARLMVLFILGLDVLLTVFQKKTTGSKVCNAYLCLDKANLAMRETHSRTQNEYVTEFSVRN